MNVVPNPPALRQLLACVVHLQPQRSCSQPPPAGYSRTWPPMHRDWAQQSGRAPARSCRQAHSAGAGGRFKQHLAGERWAQTYSPKGIPSASLSLFPWAQKRRHSPPCGESSPRWARQCGDGTDLLVVVLHSKQAQLMPGGLTVLVYFAVFKQNPDRLGVRLIQALDDACGTGERAL